MSLGPVDNLYRSGEKLLDIAGMYCLFLALYRLVFVLLPHELQLQTELFIQTKALAQRAKSGPLSLSTVMPEVVHYKVIHPSHSTLFTNQAGGGSTAPSDWLVLTSAFSQTHPRDVKDFFILFTDTKTLNSYF